MSWYNSSWNRRAAISVPFTGSTGAKDVEITIPKEWDFFWDTVDATSGRDIRVTQANGLTLVDFDLSGFDASTRTCVLQLDGVTLTADHCCIFWLYWDGTDTDASTTVSISTPFTGYICLERPDGLVVDFLREVAGSVVAAQEVGKTSGETVDVWWRVGSQLTKRRTAHAGRHDYEEVTRIAARTDQEGSEDTAMTTDADTRLVEVDGTSWVRTRHSGGTAWDGSSEDGLYLLRCTCTTTLGPVLEGRCVLKVFDPVED